MSALHSTSVLVVDDVPLMIAVVRSVLRQIGFERVEEAQHGEDALACLRARRHGLVIADLNMSPMTGLELLRHVRADAALRETPFVLMSTKEHLDSLVRARQAGANGCLVKPFTIAALGETIRTVVPQARTQASPNTPATNRP